MKLRFKFLCFIAVFLSGSFLIVTWKSFDIFSRKYVQTFQHMQLQDLEKQSALISAQFEGLQILLKQNPEDLETQLKARDIALFAHVIKEDGKWKAQWFEGKPGMRAMAQGVAQQIPFESLSTTKKSWQIVRMKDQGVYMAYVIPSFSNDKSNYYTFFFKKEFLNRLLKGSSLMENLTLLSKQVGEVYSVGERSAEQIERHKDLFEKKQSGIISLSSTLGMAYYFHPDLQLFFIKDFTMKSFVVESAAYLMALFAIIVILVGLAVFALDMLLKNLFVRVGFITTHLRLFTGASAISDTHYGDELTELEMLTEKMMLKQEKPIESQQEQAVTETKSQNLQNTSLEHEEFLKIIRPKAINSLGYLNRLKMQIKTDSPHLQLLEKELRELRHLIDPTIPVSLQPSFNPLVEFVNVDKKTAVQIEEDKVEKPSSLFMSIRKPKRETHESH